jgi:hypothetical protein
VTVVDIDERAFEFWTSRGALTVPTADGGTDLSPEEAVFSALARHLSRIEARVESGRGDRHTALRFVDVNPRWKDAWRAAAYPSAAISSRSVNEWAAEVGRPMPHPARTGEDLFSADGEWALWDVGEDDGEGVVVIAASYEPHAKALAEAVRDALFGDLDRQQGITLPLPEAFLPAPFRGLLLAEQLPVARVAFRGHEGTSEQDGESGVWRADIRFHWQAPRVAARKRIPDLIPKTSVQVCPPGQES